MTEGVLSHDWGVPGSLLFNGEWLEWVNFGQIQVTLGY